jgi:hypothetical protein
MDTPGWERRTDVGEARQPRFRRRAGSGREAGEVGKLEKNDYDEILVPALTDMIARTGAIRMVFVFGDRYEGLTAGGTWADAKLYVGELAHRDLSKWKRCAVVTGHDWLRHSISMFRWMMPGEVEVFDPSDIKGAIACATG